MGSPGFSGELVDAAGERLRIPLGLTRRDDCDGGFGPWRIGDPSAGTWLIFLIVGALDRVGKGAGIRAMT